MSLLGDESQICAVIEHHESHHNDMSYSNDYQYDVYMYAEYGIEW